MALQLVFLGHGATHEVVVWRLAAWLVAWLDWPIALFPVAAVYNERAMLKVVAVRRLAVVVARRLRDIARTVVVKQVARPFARFVTWLSFVVLPPFLL